MNRTMKAFLRASDGTYSPLSPKVTTIGKDGCDIILQANGVDQQHAIIEYSEQEDCYVLQDLNTAQGTYVNDVRVQNAAVRLAPGDVIRFGFGGMPYELNVENPPPISYPPVQQRPAWTGTLALITDDRNMYTTTGTQCQAGLPYLTTPTLTIPSAHWTPIANGQQPLTVPQPRPPLRSRPLSAGSRRPTSAYDRLQTISTTMQSQTAPAPRSGGWMNTGTGRSVVTSQSPGHQINMNTDMHMLQEKDQRIHQLSEEVGRLRAVEADSYQKEQQLQQFQVQLQELQNQLQQQQQLGQPGAQSPLILGGDQEVTSKLVQLETEVSAKKQEVLELREQFESEDLLEELARLQAQSDSELFSPEQFRTELNAKIQEVNSLRNEMERVKKDKNITSGLVTQMQRDMSSKDTTISRMTREIEALKKELRERDSQLSTMSSKVKSLKEPKTEERDARERELISLRQKFKSTESKVADQQTLIDSLREELEKTKASLFAEKDVQRKLQTSIEEAKAKAQDFERAERVVRVDLEQTSKKNERFRNRVVQTTFSTPGIKAPDTEISDDELLDTLKKIIDERTNSFRQIKELEQKLKMSDTNNKDFQKSFSDLRKTIMNAKLHLKQNGRLSGSLKEELGMIQSLTPEENLVWIKDAFLGLLQGELSWETDIETALEKCGVNVKLTNDEPSKHIALLYAKWESALGEKERLVKQMADMEVSFKVELQQRLDLQKVEAEGKITDAAERAKLEVEERLNRAIDDIRAVEAEKQEAAVESERRKIEDLQATIEQLRANLLEKNDDQQSKLEAGQEALKQVEDYLLLEAQLREQIACLESGKANEVARLSAELLEKDQKYDAETVGYKEQIKQHSVTICAMEERITKVMKKNKECQEEAEVNRRQVQELKLELSKKPKPELPPKPKIVPVVQKPSHDVVAMEQLILVLRKENGEMKKHLQEQEDVILGLRRDLAGASARLSDITGELSEGQKQEVEKFRSLVNNKEKEVIEMRQQLAKLSRIIDKQKDELKTMEAELSKERSISIKYKNIVDKETQRSRSLEESLEAEKVEQAKQLELLDQEGRITSELTSLGAQCRGERHEQVISRQREALSELRVRVKNLETARPPVPTQDQALQQVIVLKKELAEMRANQALAEDKNITNLTSLDREVGRARGLVTTTNAEADMERSAHRETMEALESSENTYINLLNAMSVSLDLEGVEGMRSLSHIPKDERERLLRERERACEKLSNQIRVYRERITRKDELLMGYERDLAKLRQAQEIADRKSVQVESLANDVRTRSEESQYLRESLHQTRDKLDQEKRLNTAIKQRKTFHLENEKVHLAPASHRCKPEDPRAVLTKKNQREVLKRKNYEIKTLKTELTDKERHLFDAQNKLYTVQHSQVEGINNVEYQLRVSLFDVAYRQFFGRQWAGQYSSLHGVGGQAKPKLRLSQSIYFHTSLVSSNIIAVVELVASGLDTSQKLKKQSCGWGIIRPFKEDELPDTSRGVKPAQQKCKLYSGTPRALYFMDEPIEECELLRPIPECQLGYTVATHKAMYHVCHLLPENTVVGNNDIIPGLMDSDSAAKDTLKRPKILKPAACSIEQLTVQLNPTVEKFEEELCEQLKEDKNIQSPGTNVFIVERRLLAGVHNGWTFVEKPQTFLLDARYITSKSLKPGASPTFRRSQRFKSSQKLQPGEDGLEMGNYLVLNQKIQINDLLEDPMFAVVFILEYVIGEQLSEQDRKMSKSLARGNSRTVTLRWSAWNPFLQATSPHVTVGLIGGPFPSPDGEFVYKVPDTAMQDEISARAAGGLMAFQWGFCIKDGASSGTHPIHPMAFTPGFQMGSAQSMRSGGASEPSEAGALIESPTSVRKPPSGRPSITRPPAGLQHAAAGSILQPQQVPMQYPQIYAQSMPQQMYIPMSSGPVPMYGLPGPATDLQELQHVPAHQPILTAGPQPKKGAGLSRAAYAKLYSVGFPPVLDRNGDPPEVIDPNTHIVSVDLQREYNDSLQCNEVIFQFLAFSRMQDLEGASSEPAKTGGTVFFSFQFYRNQQVTTERLLLSKPQTDLSSDISCMPYILQRLDKDGTNLKGPPGLEVRYFMDPAYMKPGETQLFLQHLSQQTMYIDVWDGDTLLPLGSTAVDLKYLCRDGAEGVQTTFELDIVSTEYEEDPNLAHSDAGAGGIRPANVHSVVKGKLHLRLANIGHPADPKSSTTAFISLPSKSLTVVSQIASSSGYGGGSLVAGQPKTEQGLTAKKRVARASHMAENNSEVAALLFSKRDEVEPVTESNREGDAERQRKLARMQALRNLDGGIEKPQTLMSMKQLKSERARDLKTVEIYRLQTKKDGIEAMLSQSISTEHIIHPSFGATEFFEFVLRNPYNVEHTVRVEFDNKNLHCITNAREWRYMKQLYQLQTPMEEGMFSRESKSSCPEVFLRPKETVHIPFKYLSFKADQTVQPQGPVDPFRQTMKTKARPRDAMRASTVKVHFKSEDDKPLAIMLLKVEPQPHVIDQTFRFHSPEQTFLKKSIRLPPLETLPGAPVGGGGLIKAVARCSDPNIICDTKTTQPGEPQDVFLKVPLGASPQIKRFFMAVYLDPFMARPIQIWQFYVHALQRVDVACVEGQTSRFSLLLRGTQASRLVQCFSSHPQEMTLYPAEQFMLAAGAVHELNVAVRPMQDGNKFFYLNVVDVEFHQLVRTWLICVSSRAPMISRAFELTLPVGGGKGCSKKITYTNPYPSKKTFLLHTNRDDLLQFKETSMDLEGGQTATIGLRFVPVLKAGMAEVLVFINDEDDKNEETFRVAARYQRM